MASGAHSDENGHRFRRKAATRVPGRVKASKFSVMFEWVRGLLGGGVGLPKVVSIFLHADALPSARRSRTKRSKAFW